MPCVHGVHGAASQGLSALWVNGAVGCACGLCVGPTALLAALLLAAVLLSVLLMVLCLFLLLALLLWRHVESSLGFLT